jgi:cytochrome d ubiquinol oxidase subunit I
VYFTVFGVGTTYLIRLMGRLPSANEVEPPRIPQHAAGITPASAINPVAAPFKGEHELQRQP